MKNQKYARGWRFNMKIRILFYGDNSWTVTLRQVKFGTVRDHRHIYKFLIFILRGECFKYSDGAKFWGYVGANSEPLYVEFCGM
jgi:hypothetical protein